MTQIFTILQIKQCRYTIKIIEMNGIFAHQCQVLNKLVLWSVFYTNRQISCGKFGGSWLVCQDEGSNHSGARSFL